MPGAAVGRERATVIRTIEGFHVDDAGDWVAELSCLHTQHVRHRPPFFDRPWVTTAHGRAAHTGSDLDCPLCDRAEIPEGLHTLRTAGPFDIDSIPAGLLREHRLGAHIWGVLRIEAGSLRFTMATDPPVDRRLHYGDTQPIPPEVTHAVELTGPVNFTIEFQTRPRR